METGAPLAHLAGLLTVTVGLIFTFKVPLEEGEAQLVAILVMITL